MTIVCFVAVGASTAATSDNSVTITEIAGTAQASRPFTISRVFAQGEIAGFAQPSVGGTPLPVWQCDRKSTWADGSLKHALISFRWSLPANGSAKVAFASNDAPSSSGAPLSQQQMLDFDTGGGVGSWDADIEVSNGTTLRADARTMLGAGKWSYWLQGPVVTQAIVEDRTTALAYDLGWDAYKPLHPIFVLTFYPGWAGVKEEAILENCWSTKLEDVTYSLAVKNGSALTHTVYSHASFNHYAAGRWRKITWDGTSPGSVKLDLNFPYLISSKALPNYDTSLAVSPSAIAAEVATYNAGDLGMDYGSRGEFAYYMPTTGGASYIGYMPTVSTRYLYTFDPTLQPIMNSVISVSGGVPVHVRESRVDTTKYCAVACTGGNATASAFGRPISIDARPTIWLFGWGRSETTSSDKITPVGTTTAGSWTVDMAHEADFAFVPYLITGDWYALEELYFWSSYNLGSGNGGNSVNYVRNGSAGFLSPWGMQERGTGWTTRTLLHTAFMAPTGTPEQQYHEVKLFNNVAIWEGILNVTNGHYTPVDTACPSYDYATASLWCWGRNTGSSPIYNPLRLSTGDPSSGLGGELSSIVLVASKPWAENFMLIVYGRVKELYPTEASSVQAAMASHLIHWLADPALNPYTVDAYRAPVKDTSGAFFHTYPDLMLGWATPYRTQTHFFAMYEPPIGNDTLADTEHNYLYIARAAASYGYGITDGGVSGTAAWNWINDPAKGISSYPGLKDNPKWAIIPRYQTPVGNSCDLNQDGVVNVLDIQLAIAQALGTAPCTNADLVSTGSCGLVDVQRVTIAALGGACRVGL